MINYYLYFDEVCEKTQHGIDTYKVISHKGVIKFTDKQIMDLMYFFSDIKYQHSFRRKVDKFYEKLEGIIGIITLKKYRIRKHKITRAKDLEKELEAFNEFSHNLTRDESI